MTSSRFPAGATLTSLPTPSLRCIPHSVKQTRLKSQQRRQDACKCHTLLCPVLPCSPVLPCLVLSCLVRSGPVYFYSITALLSAAWLFSTLVDLKRAALPRCSAQVARTCMFMLPCLAGRSFRNLEALDATVPHSPLQTRPRSFNNNSHPHRGPTTTTTPTLHCTALHCLDAQLRAHRGSLARTRIPPILHTAECLSDGTIA